MYVRVGENVATTESKRLTVRCPHCHHEATVDALGQDLHFYSEPQSTWVQTGQRKCPNPDCRAHLFILRTDNEVLVSYPPERIDFDSTGLPEPVLAALEEAI